MHQAPSSKFQAPSSKGVSRLQDLDLGIWTFFGGWNLELGGFMSSSPDSPSNSVDAWTMLPATFRRAAERAVWRATRFPTDGAAAWSCLRLARLALRSGQYDWPRAAAGPNQTRASGRIHPRCAAHNRRPIEIGRASCRERG